MPKSLEFGVLETRQPLSTTEMSYQDIQMDLKKLYQHLPPPKEYDLYTSPTWDTNTSSSYELLDNIFCLMNLSLKSRIYLNSHVMIFIIGHHSFLRQNHWRFILKTLPIMTTWNGSNSPFQYTLKNAQGYLVNIFKFAAS